MFRPQGRMTTQLSLLVIFGFFVMLTTVVISNPIPEYEHSEHFNSCKNISDKKGEAIYECIRTDYNAEQMNETLEMFSGTKCLRCKHLCRKQDALLQCMRDGAESLQSVSNKSAHMVPFIAQMMETALATLCENDGDIMNVQEDEEDKECFIKTWSKCKGSLYFMNDLDRVAFCDPANEETDPFTKGYVCQKIAEFFECSEGEVEPCSSGIKSSVTIMKSRISSLDSCAKYF